MGNQVENQKNITSALITALSILPTAPTRNEVEEKATALAQLFDYHGILDDIIEETMISIDTRMGTGVSLVDIEADHDDEWIYKRDDFSWTYSNAYEAFMKRQGWHPNMVQSLSNVGLKIVGHLQDPISEGVWDRRGLVIGHVQSGKTANYMSVISKAADAGYKFIIVIAGIHNNLRKQTQERIDEGFVGRSSNPESRGLIGVGLGGAYPHPATLTNIYDDFNTRTARQSGWKLNDFSKPIILVIKKNVKTLDSLYKWLKEMNAQGNGKISDVPMLMIDDEADNASINTNKPDIDPTKTNAMIRKILELFAKSCYVGYTATPFANIFINPETADDEFDELFPRDFIYCLDPPNTYFGPEKVFMDEETSNTIIEPINDSEDYIPFSHKKDHEVIELPQSLYKAINQFIVVRTIRNLRGHSNKHCSMMVNVSRFVNIQNTVRDLISLYLKKVSDAVKANYSMPDSVAEQNKYMLELKNRYLVDYRDCEFSWQEVKKSLWNTFGNLRLFVINSKSDEALDYAKYEKEGDSLTAIAVGGLSLSRGLTIEGLCISYMYRNTRMYDTLMQMGRWFGYRPGYEDLCRVYLSIDSINWYAHIAEASEELRQQIKRMRRDQLSPKQFGLYVRAHPDRLLITSANKMRAGQRVIVKQNFSGKLLESYILPTDDEVNSNNEALISDFWKKQINNKSFKETGKGWTVKDIPIDIIEEFLTKFRVHSSFVERKSAAINYLMAQSEIHSKGDVLFISLKNNGEDAPSFRLGVQNRDSADIIGNAIRMKKFRVASKRDEKLGLSKTQQIEAKNIAANYGTDPSDFHYRMVRQKPLLMIHIIEIRNYKRVPAFGISFPTYPDDTEIEVVANRIWIDRMHGSTTDSPDEEDDYDE